MGDFQKNPGIRIFREKPAIGFVKIRFLPVHGRAKDLVDAYIVAFSRKKGTNGVYSFDSDLKKCGLEIVDVK